MKHPNTFQRIESYKLDQEISEAINSPQANFPSHFYWIRASWSMINMVPRNLMCLKHPNTFQRIESYKLDQEISEAINSPQVNFPSHSSLPFTCDTHSLWLCLLSPSLLPTILQLLLRGFHKLPIQTTSARILCLVLTNWALPMITHCLSL